MAETATVRRVGEQLQSLVDGVEESQLGSSTPCADWDVRALLNHITGGGILFAACIRDGACPDDLLVSLMTEDQVGDDPAASFRAAVTAFLDASDAADDDTVVSTPFGEMPVATLMGMAVADLAIHTIDLALATGADLDELDPTLLATADELAHQFFPAEGRNPDFLDAPVDIADDAHPALRLAAFAGRSV